MIAFIIIASYSYTGNKHFFVAFILRFTYSQQIKFYIVYEAHIELTAWSRGCGRLWIELVVMLHLGKVWLDKARQSLFTVYRQGFS